MTKIVFLVEKDTDGGYVARGVGESIITQGGTPDELRTMVQDAVQCHFPYQAQRPRMIRMHFVPGEHIAA